MSFLFKCKNITFLFHFKWVHDPQICITLSLTVHVKTVQSKCMYILYVYTSLICAETRLYEQVLTIL